MFVKHPCAPSLAALAVNQAVMPTIPLDAVTAFRSLEKTYGLKIQLTHTGIRVTKQVLSPRSTGKSTSVETVYEKGDASASVSEGKARGAEQCAAMRQYAIEFISWATKNCPTPSVSIAANRIRRE